MKRQRMMKGPVVLLLILALVAMGMAGCGGQANNSSGTTAATSTAATSAADPNLVGNVYKTGLPIVKEKVTLKTVVNVNPNLKQPAKDLAMWKVLEDETNVHIEMEEIPQDGYNEKVNLKIASGDIPDFIYHPDIGTKHYSSGLFMALDDLIREWAPNIQKILDNPIYYANMRAADGKVYNIPSQEGAPWLYSGPQMFLNKVWLQNLNLELPKTTDELFNVLKAFKEKDPNGNKKADEIPLSIEIRDMANGAYALFGAFGLPLTSTTSVSHEMIKDGKYIFGPTQDGYKEGLMYFNKLYAAGLLDPESFTQKSTDIKAKANGEVSVVGGVIGFWPDNYVDASKVENYVLAPVPKGPKGDQLWLGMAQVPGKGTSISAKCQQPEVVARWIDNCNSSALKKAEVAYGPTSLGILSIKDGKFETMTANAPEGLTFEAWSRNNALRGMAPFCMTAEETEQYRIIDPVAGRKLAYVNEYKPYLWTEYITGATFASVTSDEQQTLATLYADMNPLINNFIAKSIIEGVSDATWVKFQDDLKKANVDKFIEIKQKALNEYNNIVGK